MRRIPDILNSSLKSFARSCFSKQAISIPFHSYSNNTPYIFDCQLSRKQINYFNEFLKENLTTSELKVFKVLMELHLKHRGNLFPSYDLLASMAGCARSTVQIAIARLKELNIIDTQFRGYRQTLIYRIHEFYLKKRKKIASLLKNVVMIAMLLNPISKSLLSSTAGALGNRYLLNKKDIFFNKKRQIGEKNVALELSDNDYEEIRKHPSYLFDRTLKVFERKLEEEGSLSDPTRYFMAIFRNLVKQNKGKPQKNRQVKTEDPKTGTTKTYVRPKSGPYAEYIHPPERALENAFELATKLEMKLHANPNIFSKIAADGHLAKLTRDDRNIIMMKVHKDCECRPDLGIEV